MKISGYGARNGFYRLEIDADDRGEKMKIGKTSDTSPESQVYELSKEIVVVFENLEQKYPHVDIELFYGFRCLPDSLGRRTFRRYSKSENVLYMDMTFSLDQLGAMSKDQQRCEVSRKFYSYTAETLEKYLVSGLDVDVFLADLKSLCKKIGWLKEEWEVDL